MGAMAARRLSAEDALGMVARLCDAVAAHVAHGRSAPHAALYAIYDACADSGHNRGAIGGTSRAIDGVLAAMASQLVDCGMMALYSLACDHAINQERIGDTTGAFGTMVAGMQAHAANIHVQTFGMQALDALAHNHVGNQHRMRASQQLLRLVALAAEGGLHVGAKYDAGQVLEALGLSPTQAHAAAAKVRCGRRYPCRTTP